MLSLYKMLEYPRSCLNSDLKIRFFKKNNSKIIDQANTFLQSYISSVTLVTKFALF